MVYAIAQESKEESAVPIPVSHLWQIQTAAPSLVEECLIPWKDGVALGEEAKRLLDRYVECANRNPHIWFCPPSP